MCAAVFQAIGDANMDGRNKPVVHGRVMNSHYEQWESSQIYIQEINCVLENLGQKTIGR